ncbi:MAG: lysophospholipid acyltransferase family protein [Deltaproteobacteria bacterium]|nr:lysophospholipid acyltransferase family protein [Deltaproteobacteria bacterium]
MKKLLDGIFLFAAPLLASWVIRFLYLTMRKTFVGFEGYTRALDKGGRILLAFWHGRLFMMRYAHPRGMTVLISQSKDGELIARTIGHLGISSVRGSSSRGAFGGVKGLLKAARAGDIGITPDGPRGPGMKAQIGIIQIAAKTGLPIIPVSFGAEKKKVFRSWDSFQLPYPFTRGVYIAGEPRHISPRATPEEMEAERQRLESELNELTERADNFFKRA